MAETRESVALTTPGGAKVWVYPAWVQAVRPALAGEHGKTTLLLSGLTISVMEEAEAVSRLLRYG